MLIDQILAGLTAPEVKTTFLTSKRTRPEFIAFLNTKERHFRTILKSFWREQSGIITLRSAKRIVDEGHSFPQDSMDLLTKGITAFVGDKIRDKYLDSLEYAGSRMASKINSMRKQEFEFDRTATLVMEWMSEAGGDLIVQLTAAQYNTINALLRHQMFMGITSPYLLAQRLKPLIPLLEKDALYITRLYEELTKAGLSQEMVLRQTQRMADLKLKNRAWLIARTELSGAYQEGNLQSVRQAVESGFVDGDPRKTWITGPDPCERECMAMGGEEVGLEETFSNGRMRSPAHPACRCDIGYSIRR